MKKFYLTSEERTLIIEGLITKKNKLLSNGKFTDGIDETMIKISKARLKKIRVI